MEGSRGSNDTHLISPPHGKQARESFAQRMLADELVAQGFLCLAPVSPLPTNSPIKAGFPSRIFTV